MAYGRYDPRDRPRDERTRWSEDRYDRDRGRPEDRGFFERAGDEIASWFGDDEAERRRREDQLSEERERGYSRGAAPDYRQDRGDYWRDRTWSHDNGERAYGGDRERSRFIRDEEPLRSTAWTGREPGRADRATTGDYGRSEGFYAASGTRGQYEPRRLRDFDPHYHSWRQRHLSELDRDYDDYRRENQSKFEDDFTSWRQRRMHKRSLLGQIREHMEVVGSDDEHVGTVDRTAGDRIILTRSDPESGGVHHSLSCSDIDRVENDRVVLDSSAGEAKQRWRDENRNRALFEREDQGEMGPRTLDRSFGGTYR
jgi:hypothetical protein